MSLVREDRGVWWGWLGPEYRKNRRVTAGSLVLHKAILFVIVQHTLVQGTVLCHRPLDGILPFRDILLQEKLRISQTFSIVLTVCQTSSQ